MRKKIERESARAEIGQKKEIERVYEIYTLHEHKLDTLNRITDTLNRITDTLNRITHQIYVWRCHTRRL